MLCVSRLIRAVIIMKTLQIFVIFRILNNFSKLLKRKAPPHDSDRFETKFIIILDHENMDINTLFDTFGCVIAE